MLKHIVLASTALMLAAPAMAQAVPVVVELEGPLESYDHPTRTMTVMGFQVEVLNTTAIHSPTATRQETGLNANQWYKGAKLPGRRQAGFLGGTAIVTGVWDAINRRVVAQDIFSEPAENVALGVITGYSCTTANCDGPTDYIRGNSAIGATFTPGPAMLPITDSRMPARGIQDEGGFALNLANATLDNVPFAAEGYYGDTAVTVPNGSQPAKTEQALHYFILDVADIAPQLLLNKGTREVSGLRADCREGDQFELRGNVHSRVNAAGILNDTVAPGGVVEVRFNQGGTQVIRTGAVTPLDVGSPYGGYRVRFDTPVCPATVQVRWLSAPGGTVYATLTGGMPVEIRAD